MLNAPKRKNQNDMTPQRENNKISRLAPIHESFDGLQATIDALSSKFPNEQLFKELQAGFDQHKAQLHGFLQSIAMMESPEEKERKRSVVIIGLPEADKGDSIDRADADSEAVVTVLRTLQVEARPDKVYRMGRRLDDKAKPRLLKVVMPSSQLQRIMLGSLKHKREALRKIQGFERAFIRPSLSKEELEKDRDLRKKLKEKRAENPNVKVYIKKGQIVVDGGGGEQMNF